MQSLKRKFKSLDEHSIEVIKKSASSTIVKVLGILIGIGVTIFLGRTLGAEGFGIISLSNQIVTVLITVALFGARQIVIKEVAIAKEKNDSVHVGNVIYSGLWSTGFISLILAIILISLSPWLVHNVFKDDDLLYPLIIALIAMTPQVFSRIYSSALIGFRKIWQASLVDQSLSALITGLLLVGIWLYQREVTLLTTAICYGVGRFVVTVSVRYYWNSTFVKNKRNKIIARDYLGRGFSFFVISLSNVVFTDADGIILGVFSSAKDVGLYAVAARMALMTSFFLQVTNASVSPKIAALYASGSMAELENMVQKITKGLFYLGAFSLFIFIVFGESILSLWGSEFKEAYWVLVILGIGQFINLGTGAVGLLLMMTNYEKLHGRIALIFSGLNIVSCILLTILFGAIGAAIGAAAIVALLNITTLIFVKKKLNISTLSFFKIESKS